MLFKKKQKEWKDFREKSFEEMDAEVEEALREERLERFKKIAIVVIFFVVLMPDAFLYWVRFATPRFPTSVASEKIDVNKYPEQMMLPPEEQEVVIYNSLEGHGEIELEKQAKYVIQGKIVARNFYFWGNYLPNHRQPFQDAALIDVGLVWGDLAQKDILRHYTFVSVRTAVGRALYPRLRWGEKVLPISWTEVNGQMSHNHVIPANARIMHALLFTHKGQEIKMEGYLVDVYKNGRLISLTSLSRNDVNQTARGGGACENIYVTRLQVGNRIYE